LHADRSALAAGLADSSCRSASHHHSLPWACVLIRAFSPAMCEAEAAPTEKLAESKNTSVTKIHSHAKASVPTGYAAPASVPEPQATRSQTVEERISW
jgi:hypothetical protein